MVEAKANGKIILIGEHSVVYGEPAIALPFLAAKIKVSIMASDFDIILDSDQYQGSLDKAPSQLKGLTLLINKVLTTLNKEDSNLYIKIESNIPSERGMGSSAAVAAATVKAIYRYFKKDLQIDVLSDFVDFLEKIVHGNPSGIDRAIVINKKPIYYTKDEPIKLFDIDLNAYLVVADTGKKGKTKIAVSKVKDFINNNPKRGEKIIKDLGAMTREAKNSIKDNDATNLGRLMNQSQKLLNELGVSNARIDNLVKVSIDSGALGSKLTGGGLGGCIISLCTSKDQAEIIEAALLKNGAYNTWIMKMSKEEDLNEG